MKQIVQDLQSGRTLLQVVPTPCVQPGHLLIRTRCSLVSVGTERMLVEFGRASLVAKARLQPEKVRLVLDKLGTDGVLPTLEAVFRKLGQPLPLGYCNAGEVIEIGQGVDGFQIGDRVASNGHHAEFVCVPANLCAPIPDAVTDEQAAFTVLGAIALQGIRLLAPTFGETVVVFGLGLIGQLAAQLLRANGCRVLGVDPDEAKRSVAEKLGIETLHGEPVAGLLAATSGNGCDAALITASASGDEIVHQAATICRKRGRIVLVGVVNLDLRRDDFYAKELSFQVSCSYGPGRYDPEYEEKGHDYPAAYVRWTEQRNFEAVLQALANGALQVGPLVTQTVPLDDNDTVYGDMRRLGALASLFTYAPDTSPERTITLPSAAPTPARGTGRAPIVGIIGAGNFVAATLAPALTKTGAELRWIASARGLSAATLAHKFGIQKATSDAEELLADPDVDLVVVATRHDSHAAHTIAALEAGKHVFVEKPLCRTSAELECVEEAHRQAETRLGERRILTVGFNRNAAPLTTALMSALPDGPVHITATMNAGHIPADSWIQDPAVGGGRIIGEACHLIALCTHIARSPVTAVCATAVGETIDPLTADTVTILLRFGNGSTSTVNYLANGARAYPKERVEVHGSGRTAIVENWRSLRGFGGSTSQRCLRQDKGHAAQFAALVAAVRDGGQPSAPLDLCLATTRAALATVESLKQNCWIRIDPPTPMKQPSKS